MKIKKFMKKAMTLCLCLALAVGTLCTGASAATVQNATIDTSKDVSFNLYKYDMTGAAADGVWDESYVSTGVRDQEGVESILGNSSKENDLGNGQTSYGYAIKGVEFTYLKVADIVTYSDVTTVSGKSVKETMVLYSVRNNAADTAFLTAIGLTAADRYAPADVTVGGNTYYRFKSDTLINALSAALAENSTAVKNALEAVVKENGGTALPETDSCGHTGETGMEQGLYLIVETRVPEMVTSTTDPFFVSLPMTTVNGNNAENGGEEWLYDVTVYPKNATGNPTLEKTVRESHADTGDNEASDAIDDGYAHTASGSDADVMEYQIISKLPTITSESTYLSVYTFEDTLEKGLSYNKDDVVIEFFTDADCTEKVASWTENDRTAKFAVSYANKENGDASMTISMTAAGLAEINGSTAVYDDDSLKDGYSDLYLRITYAATVDSDNTVTYGDVGNDNEVVLTWKRTNSSYYDILKDCCHVFTYGIDLTKEFSDDAGDFSKVEFIVKNTTDGYFVTASLNESEGVYYVTGHKTAEADATHFVPTSDGKIIIKGLEDDTYVLTEVKTDNGYTLLKDDITVVITASASGETCELCGVTKLVGSASVDGKAVTMLADNGSADAEVPLTVVNTRGFDLPKTGDNGVWMYGVGGSALLLLTGVIALMADRRKKAKDR